MIEIEIYPVTPIETNCCYLFDSGSGESAVVDPGGESAELNARIEAGGGKLKYVILTHGHYDHICFAKQLADKYSAKLVTGKHNAPFLSDTRLNGTAAHGIPFTPFSADILLEDGETFSLGETKIKYLYTPGHTSGCGVYIFDDVMISGDLIFRCSLGRTDLPTGDYRTIVESMRRIKELEGDYRIIPGHGPMTTLAYERRFNPLMRML